MIFGTKKALIGSAFLIAGLAISSPSARADVLGDCIQMHDRERRISACTALIDRGGERNEIVAMFHHNRGQAYGREKDYDRAIADLTKAIELNSKYAKAYYERGLVHGDKGKYDQAIADFSTAIELVPSYYLAYMKRGLVHERKGNRDQAIRDFRMVLSSDRMNSPPLAAINALKRLGVNP